MIEITPPEKLVLSWKGGPLDTVVTFVLAELPGGHTRLTLRHEGFRGLSNIIPRMILGSGWKTLLAKKLATTVAREPSPAEA